MTELTISPINDPRPFSDVLRTWLDARQITAYAAAPILGTTQQSIGRWLSGQPCAHERRIGAAVHLVTASQFDNGSLCVLSCFN